MVLQYRSDLNHVSVVFSRDIYNHHPHQIWLCIARETSSTVLYVNNRFFRQRNEPLKLEVVLFSDPDGIRYGTIRFGH